MKYKYIRNKYTNPAYQHRTENCAEDEEKEEEEESVQTLRGPPKRPPSGRGLILFG